MNKKLIILLILICSVFSIAYKQYEEKPSITAEYFSFIKKANHVSINGIELSDQDRKALQEILTTNNSYIIGSTKFTQFIPSVKIVIQKGDETRTLVLSHHAKKVEFLDKTNKPVTMLDIREAQFEELDLIIGSNK